MIRKCLLASLLLIAAAGCVSDTGRRTTDGPRYMQEGIGSGPRQTDLFGNSLLP